MSLWWWLNRNSKSPTVLLCTTVLLLLYYYKTPYIRTPGRSSFIQSWRNFWIGNVFSINLISNRQKTQKYLPKAPGMCYHPNNTQLVKCGKSYYIIFILVYFSTCVLNFLHHMCVYVYAYAYVYVWCIIRYFIVSGHMTAINWLIVQ